MKVRKAERRLSEAAEQVVAEAEPAPLASGQSTAGQDPEPTTSALEPESSKVGLEPELKAGGLLEPREGGAHPSGEEDGEQGDALPPGPVATAEPRLVTGPGDVDSERP